ncbi:hypothetical protein AB6A40_006655 [Gnathostoma spinigerum]|uniref:Uncharacterized protein n=1 Tax=Gnathostoma spinigerum TaxID=75299 RepID=A0ABD6ER74_9BILA
MPECSYLMALTFAGEISAYPLVYSPQFLLERSVFRICRSLSSQPTNINNISMIVSLINSIIKGVQRASLSRERIVFYPEICAKLLQACERVVMVDRIRGDCVQTLEDLLNRFDHLAQLLVIKRLIWQIKHNVVRYNLESQVLAWLVDLYRRRLDQSEVFQKELGFMWGLLSEFHYESLQQSSHFHAAVLVLARYQALKRMNKSLLEEVVKSILLPFKAQLADWAQLEEISSKNDRTKLDEQTNITDLADRFDALPFLQFLYLQTWESVCAFVEH